jgi:hypothetical protein
VRVNGKPRHEFVLGLASQKDNVEQSDRCWFWVHAVRQMTEHGISEPQRHRLIIEMIRNGAKLPTSAASSLGLTN